MGRLQRDARPAAPEDVAAHRPGTFRGGVGVSTDGGRHWTRRRTRAWRSRRSRTCCSTRRARRAAARSTRPRSAAASTSPPTAAARGRSKNTGLAPTRGTSPSPGGSRSRRTARSTSSSRGAASAGSIGDAGRRRALPLDRRRGALAGRCPLPAGTNGPNGLTVDPDDPRRLYLSAWGVTRPDGDTGGGIFLTTDAGTTWRPVFTEAQHVYDVTIDPARSEAALHLRLRPGGVPLRRPRRDVDAHPRLQLQVGPPRDARPERRLEGLRHHLRRQRVARPCGRRPERDRGRRAPRRGFSE